MLLNTIQVFGFGFSYVLLNNWNLICGKFKNSNYKKTFITNTTNETNNTMRLMFFIM